MISDSDAPEYAACGTSVLPLFSACEIETPSSPSSSISLFAPFLDLWELQFGLVSF